MKKIVVLCTLISSLLIGGCSVSKGFTIESKEFTEEQNEILALTGNRAFKYELENLPQDKAFDLKIVYEVYKNKEKVKSEDILGMGFGPTEEKIEDIGLSITIQDNKVRIMSGGSYTTFDVEENISRLTNYYFTGGRKINIGDEVCLFHASEGGIGATTENLGLISKEEINKITEENDVNVFIKLVCEEK